MQKFLSSYGYEILIFIAIFCAVLIAFGHSIFQPFAPLDDYHLIVQNLAVRQWSFSSLQWIFTHFDPELYIPITFLSFQLEHLVAGISPWLYHLDNLILHTLNAFLVYKVCKHTQGSQVIALCCALIFAVHPITTEAVVWASGRKDLLATFFGLSSLLLAIRSIEKNSVGMYIASAILFVLGLLSKISIAPLALLLPFFLSKNISLKDRYKISSPFLIATIILGIVAVAGKESVVGSTAVIDRLLLSSTALVELLTRILLPMNLSVYYAPPFPVLSGVSIASVIIVACLMVSVWFFRKKFPAAALGLNWFILCALLPVLNVTTGFRASGSTFASDRYAYLALIGILLVVGSVASWCIERLDVSAKKVLIAGTVILCGIFVIASRKQTLVWESATDLYSNAVKAEPTSVHARIALARMLRENNKDIDAFEVLKQGLQFSNDAALHLAAASLYAKAGQIEDAEKSFEKVKTMEPEAAEPLYGLGVLANFKGHTNEAEQLFRSAIEKEPKYTRARMALADLFLKKGDSMGAEDELRKALVFDEWNAELLQKISEILAINGKKEESAAFQEKADLLKGDLP